MLDEEIGDAMDISAISCQRYSPGETVEGTFYDFSIYLALSDQDIRLTEFGDDLSAGVFLLHNRGLLKTSVLHSTG